MSRLRLLQDANDADKAWMVEVVNAFGERESGLARYHDDAKGDPGTPLRELYNAYVRTRDAYRSA